jgi:hypothetical protein
MSVESDDDNKMVGRWLEIEALAKEAGLIDVGQPLGEIELEGETVPVNLVVYASPGKPGVSTEHLYRFAELVAAYLGKQTDSA